MSNEASTRKIYRTEIPNIVDDSNLSVYAFRLYVHIKRVAGEHGACWQSTRTLSERCNMSTGKVSAAKKELLDAGLITLKNGETSTSSDTIKVVDVWDENYETYAQSETERNQTVNNEVRSHYERTSGIESELSEVRSRDEQVRSRDEQVRSRDEQVRSRDERKKEPVKELTKEEKRKRGNKASVYEVTASRNSFVDTNGTDSDRDVFFELYAWICGIDWQTCNSSKRGQLNQACGKLKDAGYTEQDLRAFWQDVWLTDWRWTKHGSRPTIQQVRNEIGKVRDDPIPGEQQGAMTEISNIDWSDLSKINPDELSMDARSVYYSLKYDREIATTA